MSMTIPPSAPTVLWQTDVARCDCRHHADGTIEILLLVSDVIVERRFFESVDHATDYALDKMNTYCLR